MTRASSRPGRISAKAAPPSPPIATGKLTLTASAHGSTLRWEKLTVAESAPIRTGTRLVALAEIGSSPIIIRMGKDTAEPDDAAVLRKPQANPAPIPNTKDQTSYSNQPGIISWRSQALGGTDGGCGAFGKRRKNYRMSGSFKAIANAITLTG